MKYWNAITPAYMSEESTGEGDEGPVITKHSPSWRSAGTETKIAMAIMAVQ